MKLSVFNENDEVLLLGEGNFSFAIALFRKNLNINITASCYESDIREAAKTNSEILKENGLQVLSGIDATKLMEYPDFESRFFDKIVFNFPHVGGKMRIEKNRSLLKNFFSSVGDFLKPNGQIIMTLCNGQGGTPADNPRRSWSDSWQVVEMAAHGNFILTDVEIFQVPFFENYIVTGYRSLEKGFNTEGSLTHYFKRVSKFENTTIAPKIKLDSNHFDENWKNFKWIKENKNNHDPVSLYPLRFSFDITFSVDVDFCDKKLNEVLYNFAGRIVNNVEFIGCYEFQNSGKITRTYRISYMSHHIPLYKKRVIDIHQNIIAKILEDNLNVIVTR